MTTSCIWNAEDYQRHSDQQQRWARELIAKFHLRGDEQVPDIGCGDGKVTAEIAVYVPRGRGNAAALMETVDDLMTREPWRPFFAGFAFPYAFCGPEEYGDWMRAAGL